MIEVKFKVPIKAKAQVYADKNSDTDDILQAIKDEVLTWDITDFNLDELEIDYGSMEEVDFDGWI
ncbi:hypothetical protein [Anaerococcus sp.]|uniref:hypothetical protein n=1 Tax=Anaerococcus sp. TaxID=1872515 RepID=UPI002A91EE41|nr:hypothetical protein [Anaerococcus sp.]MDY6127018.1 hypothetical protein [Anaerococcus sp.]